MKPVASAGTPGFVRTCITSGPTSSRPGVRSRKAMRSRTTASRPRFASVSAPYVPVLPTSIRTDSPMRKPGSASGPPRIGPPLEQPASTTMATAQRQRLATGEDARRTSRVAVVAAEVVVEDRPEHVRPVVAHVLDRDAGRVAGGRVLEGAEGPPVPEVDADRDVADVLGPFAEGEDADRIARDHQLADDRAVALRGDERLGLSRERTPGSADRGPASGRERGARNGA